jgi:hypothetical protein
MKEMDLEQIRARQVRSSISMTLAISTGQWVAIFWMNITYLLIVQLGPLLNCS